MCGWGGVAGNWVVKVYKQSKEPAVQEAKWGNKLGGSPGEEAWPAEHGNRQRSWDRARKETGKKTSRKMSSLLADLCRSHSKIQTTLVILVSTDLNVHTLTVLFRE